MERQSTVEPEPNPTLLFIPGWQGSGLASENDPYLPLPLARSLAGAWGSEFMNAGHAGHINVASGHGDWPEGEQLLGRLLMPLTTSERNVNVKVDHVNAWSLAS